MQGFCQADPGKPPVSLAIYWDHTDHHVHDLYSKLLESTFIRAIEPKLKFDFFFPFWPSSQVVSLLHVTLSCRDECTSVFLDTIGIMRKWFVPRLIGYVLST